MTLPPRAKYTALTATHKHDPAPYRTMIPAAQDRPLTRPTANAKAPHRRPPRRLATTRASHLRHHSGPDPRTKQKSAKEHQTALDHVRQRPRPHRARASANSQALRDLPRKATHPDNDQRHPASTATHTIKSPRTTRHMARHKTCRHKKAPIKGLF